MIDCNLTANSHTHHSIDSTKVESSDAVGLDTGGATAATAALGRPGGLPILDGGAW